jgi:hypothetical protein
MACCCGSQKIIGLGVSNFFLKIIGLVKSPHVWLMMMMSQNADKNMLGPYKLHGVIRMGPLLD